MTTNNEFAVTFRFHRLRGTEKREPSATIRNALQTLTEAEEMRDFVASARSQGRNVVVEVFHSRDGHPLLIHTAATPPSRKPHQQQGRSGSPKSRKIG